MIKSQSDLAIQMEVARTPPSLHFRCFKQNLRILQVRRKFSSLFHERRRRCRRRRRRREKKTHWEIHSLNTGAFSVSPRSRVCCVCVCVLCVSVFTH